MEDRLVRIEDMVGQLIQMGVTDNKEQRIDINEPHNQDVDKLRRDLEVLRKDLDKFRSEQKSFNKKISDQLDLIRADMDHIWAKEENNERKIAILEQKLGVKA